MKKVKVLAFFSAVATAVLLFVFLNSLNQPMEVTKTSVITAAVDIPTNTPITAEMITLSEIPVEAVLSGALTDTTVVIGKISQYKIFAGEQLMNAKLISAGESGNKTLAYAIEPGMRAITIAVDITSGLSNMITPGNHIDLIGQFLSEKIMVSTNNAEEGSIIESSTGTEKISYTTMVLENITVLAVDNVLSESGKISSESPSYATLTLQVTPKQAMELSMAVFEGQLRAILRSPLDENETNLPSLTLDDIMIK